MFFKKIKSFTRDYFTLTSRERNGALALAFIIVIQISIVVWLYYLSSSNTDLHKFEIEIIAFQKRIAAEEQIKKNKSNIYKNAFQSNILPQNLFAFDPNTLADSLWKDLGLSSKQISIIRNFLSKGGSFRKKEDLAAIYGISENDFQQLEPFIHIQEEEIKTNNKFPAKAVTKKAPQIIEINTADTTNLCALPLIGPGRARMIFKYRELLGGFVNERQLLEVFSMDSTVLDAIRPQIKIDKTVVRKFNLNSDELRHPYISKQLVYMIKAYRKQHGNFTNLDQLKHFELVNTELLSKLVPYAAFE
jgi:competence protein ComEA